MALAGIVVEFHYYVKEERRKQEVMGRKETMKMSIHSMIFDVCMCLSSRNLQPSSYLRV